MPLTVQMLTDFAGKKILSWITDVAGTNTPTAPRGTNYQLLNGDDPVADLAVQVGNEEGLGLAFVASVGAADDLAASSDTGTFTIVSLAKRGLQRSANMETSLVTLGTPVDAAVSVGSGSIAGRLRAIMDYWANVGPSGSAALEGDTGGTLNGMLRGVTKILGSTGDAAVTTSTGASISAKLRGVLVWLGTLGSTSDIAVNTDLDGTINGHVRGLVVNSVSALTHLTTIATRLPSTLARKAAGDSLAVVLSTEDKASLDAVVSGLSRLSPEQPEKYPTFSPDISRIWTAEPIIPAPSAAGVHLVGAVFSTDSAVALRLHAARMAEYNARIASDGAVLHWPANVVSSPVVAAIGGKNLAAIGAPLYQQASYITADGRSIQLDGVDDGFVNSTAPSSMSAGAFECWFNPSAWPVGVANRILAFGDAASTRHMGLGIRVDHRPTFIMRNTAVVWDAMGPDMLALDNWYHFVVQHTGLGSQGLRFFLNGRKYTPTYTTGSEANVQWVDDIIGSLSNITLGFLRGATDSNFFAGKITQAAIYSATLSDQTWEDHYRLGSTLWGPHNFGASGGVGSAFPLEITAPTGSGIWASTDAAIIGSLDLFGYEA